MIDKIIKFFDSRIKYHRPNNPMSKGEIAVLNCLNELNVKYMYQFRIGNLNADFGVFVNKKWCLIEYNGGQHYHPVAKFGGIPAFCRQVFRDLFVKFRCWYYDIPLLVIPYWERDINKCVKQFINKESTVL